MNKTAIKNFAIWARNKLIADISYKAGLLGITEKGIKSPLPQSTQTVQFFDIGTKEPSSIAGTEIQQRKKLVEEIERKARQSDYATAYKNVIEEVAYTWFNRLIAIRFMEVNDYLPTRIRVLSSESNGKAEPDLVTHALEANLDYSAYEKDRIIQLKHENKLDELFRMLFIKQCNALNSNLPKLFEKTSDYSELLLNVSFTDKEGVVYHLVNDISEDDFNVSKEGQVEIIGWLYQFYNTEPKDETFALLKKNVKITKDRIPAATQLFTPDWIVRYMVENSLGRLWIEGHPNNELKSIWKYYLDEAEQEDIVQKQLDKIREEYKNLKPEDIKIIDPCCGSGGMFIQSEKFVEDHQGKVDNLSIYGQELNSTTWKLCRMNLAIRGLDANLGPHHEDTFHNDLHKTLKADYILANPPFNISDWGGERLKDDVRWKYGIPPTGNANYAWLQHMVYHLAPNGAAGIVLANGSLSSNTSNEGEIRKNLLEADLVDAIVALPDKLFYSTGIPVSLWILNRNKKDNPSFRSRENEVLFIDARKLGEMIDRRHRELSEEDVQKISETYHSWRNKDGDYEDIQGFCKSAKLEEIRGHEYVLTPGRYVGIEEVEDDGIPFDEKMENMTSELAELFAKSRHLEEEIRKNLGGIGYEF